MFSNNYIGDICKVCLIDNGKCFRCKWKCENIELGKYLYHQTSTHGYPLEYQARKFLQELDKLNANSI